MGNEVSAEEEVENAFLEEGFNLEDPEADGKINFGTAAPNCQPKHTRRREDIEEEQAVEVEIKKNNSAASVQSAQNQQQQQQPQDPKKMSYIQMAKMGYQELVNAIIRPPRAEYKVCAHWVHLMLTYCIRLTLRMS